VVGVADVPPESSERATAVERRILSLLMDAADLTMTLEVGTGEGRLTPLLAARSSTTVGIDLEASRLRSVRTSMGPASLAIHFARADANRLPFADAAFSTVVLIRIVHRFVDPLRAFREMRRVIRPNGTLILSAVTRPSAGTLAWDVGASLHGSALASRITFMRENPAVVRTHAQPGYLWTLARLREILSEAGFVVRTTWATGWEDLPVLRNLPLPYLQGLTNAWGRAPLAPRYLLAAAPSPV